MTYTHTARDKISDPVSPQKIEEKDEKIVGPDKSSKCKKKEQLRIVQNPSQNSIE